MAALLAGFGLMYTLLLGWGIGAQAEWLRYQPGNMTAWLVLVVVIVPICCAWITIEAVHLLTPRRIFDRRLRRGWSRFAIGLGVGAVGVVCGAVLLALPGVDRAVPDSVVLGASASFAVTLGVLPLSRRHPGHCIYCGYDLRHSPGPGKPGSGMCPECGATGST